MRNRSVPTDILLPHVAYQDVAAAIAWLTKTFGFVEHYRYGEPAQGAQMHLGDAWVMLSVGREGRSSPAQAGVWTQSMTIYVADVEAHYEKAKAAGAKIVQDLRETVYGERLCSVDDPEGHTWEFSQHVRDVSPTEWGAVIAP